MQGKGHKVKDKGHMSNRGQILIPTVILIIVVTIIISGVIMFLSEMTRLTLARAHLTKAVYAAQAGVYAAIVDYTNNGFITAETDTEIADNLYYSISGSSMFFLTDCSNPSIIASRKLKNISMTNVNSVDSLTITHMQVSWTPDGGEDIISIDLGHATAEWTGTAQSGTNIDIIDFTIPASTTENDIWLDWAVGSDITSMTVTAVLTFSDASTVDITLLDNGLGSSNAMMITATGKVTARETWKRTIIAGYDVGTDEIISWRESTSHL